MKYSQLPVNSNSLHVKVRIKNFFIQLRRQLEMMWAKRVTQKHSFEFQGQKYPYFFHRYNQAWKNERTIEVPIIWGQIQKPGNKRILEVGNVLSHYYKVKHDILDKYEAKKNVINEDIVSYTPKEKYDLVVSISTFEHIGWDEEIKDPHKIFRVLENVKNILNDAGELIFTIPLGQNPHIDKHFKTGQIKCSRVSYLRRMNQENEWQQITADEAFTVKYNDPFPWANAILVGSIEKKDLP